MDNRISGLLIVIAVLLFLWLYDTGRWGAIVAIVQNKPLQPATSTSSNTSSSNSGGGGLGSIVSTVGSVVGAIGSIFGF